MEEQSDYDYYIYVFGTRIIRIFKTRRSHNAVASSGVKYFVTNFLPKGLSIEDLVFKYNFSLTHPNKFYLPEEEELSKDYLDNMKLMAIKIDILERFEAACDILKMSAIKTSTFEDIYNRLMMREIEQYEKNGEVGSILEAEFKCSKFETVETLIEYIKLKYDDASEIFAYIRYKNYDIVNLLTANNLQDANDIIKEIYQKLAM